MISSVPSKPIAVVTPADVNSLKGTVGTLLAYPVSPPPPVMWVCPSIKPGTKVLPSKSYSMTSRPTPKFGFFAPT